jgi:hypothetical protein
MEFADLGEEEVGSPGGHWLFRGFPELISLFVDFEDGGEVVCCGGLGCLHWSSLTFLFVEFGFVLGVGWRNGLLADGVAEGVLHGN